MMPNMDPRTMRNLMAKMGIKSSEISATRVVIEGEGSDIIIENPQITRIEAQGTVSFQISGDITESERTDKEAPVTVTEEDIDMVAEKTGVSDKELIRQKLIDDKGDIAQAILDLSEGKES